MRDKFDFDIGYLIQSPCRTCTRYEQFPECFRACPTLDRVQTLLAQGISSTQNATDTDYQAFGK